MEKEINRGVQGGGAPRRGAKRRVLLQNVILWSVFKIKGKNDTPLES